MPNDSVAEFRERLCARRCIWPSVVPRSGVIRHGDRRQWSIEQSAGEACHSHRICVSSVADARGRLRQ